MANRSAAAAEHRAERRSNLFVLAALHCRGQGAPIAVRVRNLSPTGALVEGPDLPATGSAVRLARGALTVEGEVTRRDDTSAGVRFIGLVQISDWLPGTRNHRQQRVDQLVMEARAGRARQAGGGAPDAPSPPDYSAIARSLHQASEALLGDPDLVRRHPGALQAIAIAAQALERLGDAQ